MEHEEIDKIKDKVNEYFDKKGLSNTEREDIVFDMFYEYRVFNREDEYIEDDDDEGIEDDELEDQDEDSELGDTESNAKSSKKRSKTPTKKPDKKSMMKQLLGKK